MPRLLVFFHIEMKASTIEMKVLPEPQTPR